MPITRQFDYLAGSLAKGEEVATEFDAIIAFLNDLETDKLDVVGGTVDALTVTGAFITNGANTFNGSSVFNDPLTINDNIAVAGGVNTIFQAGAGKVSFAQNVEAPNGDFYLNQCAFHIDNTSTTSTVRIGNVQGDIEFNVGTTKKVKLLDNTSNGKAEINGTDLTVNSPTINLLGASIKMTNLPTSAGASGSLWVDTGAGNVVKRVP